MTRRTDLIPYLKHQISIYNEKGGTVVNTENLKEVVKLLEAAEVCDLLLDGINLSRHLRNDWSLSDRGLKLVEEVGEVSEAILAINGRFKHKKMKEPVEGELADVMLQCMDVLGKAYPERSREELILTLAAQMILKLAKWQRILDENAAN